MQEMKEEQEMERGQEYWDKGAGTVDRILDGVRKYSTFIPKDGGNVQLMDPSLSISKHFLMGDFILFISRS